MVKVEYYPSLPKMAIIGKENNDVLRSPYGNFSIAVLLEVLKIDPNAPYHVLTLGDNWAQIAVLAERYDILSRMNQTGNQEIVYSNIWPIMERPSHFTLLDWLTLLKIGTSSNTLDPRVPDRLAILDLIGNPPLVQRQTLHHVVETPWGYNGRTKEIEATYLYVIQNSFIKSINSMVKSISDNTTMAYHS